MPKKRKLFQIAALSSLIYPLVSCETKAPVTSDTVQEEITLNVSFQGGTFKYDGRNHSISIVGSLPDNVIVTYVGNNQSQVGEYNVIANFFNSVDPSKKYKSLSAKMTIVDDPNDYDFSSVISDVIFPDQTVTYTGKAVDLRIDNLPEGYTVTYSKNDQGGDYIDVGTYIVYATISNRSGTKVFNKSAILTILPKSSQLTNIKFRSRTFIYNGLNRSLEIEGELPSYLTVQYSNNAQVDPGTYTVIATFISSNQNIEAPMPMYATLRIVDEMTHTVTFVDDDNNVLSTLTGVYDGSSLSEDSVPDFLPEKPDAYIKNYDKSLLDNIRDDVTCKVTYSLNTFSINYITPRGVSNPNNPTSYTYLDSFSLSEPTIDKGYYFVGYYETFNPVTKEYSNPINSIKINSVGNKTIYSKVEQIPESGVTFKNVFATYDGNEKTGAPSGNVLPSDKYSITYFNSLGEKLSSAPTNAGIYQMTMEYFRKSPIDDTKYVQLKDFKASLIIEKASLKDDDSDSIEVVCNSQGIIYENNVFKGTYQKGRNVILSLKDGYPSYLNYKIEYFTSSNQKLADNLYPVNAGSYYAKISFSSKDSNHIAPSPIYKYISIAKKTISLTASQKENMFPSKLDFVYEKGVTHRLQFNYDAVPEELKDVIYPEYYENEQATSPTLDKDGNPTYKVAKVYLGLANDNYEFADGVNYIEAKLQVVDNVDKRIVHYMYVDGTGQAKEIIFRDDFNNIFNSSSSYKLGYQVPEFVITKDMFGRELLTADGVGTSSFFLKDKVYGWISYSWQLKASNDVNSPTLDSNIIPSSAPANQEYYMFLMIKDEKITVKPFKHNLSTADVSDDEISYLGKQSYNLQDLYDKYKNGLKAGYKLSYLYTDPNNPENSKIDIINKPYLSVGDYLYLTTPVINIYPMIEINEVPTDGYYNIYFKYLDSQGNYQFINPNSTTSSTKPSSTFKVPYGDVIPYLADVYEEGFIFTGWYVQDSEPLSGVSDPSLLTSDKRLSSSYYLERLDNQPIKDIYVYGELKSRKYDLIIDFEGEESFIIKDVMTNKKIFTEQIKQQLLNRIEAYRNTHLSLGKFSGLFLTSSNSEINILAEDFLYPYKKNIVLKPKYDSIFHYTRFEAEGASSSFDIFNNQNGGKGVKQYENEKFSLPAITNPEGYLFKYWILKKQGDPAFSKIITSSSTVSLGREDESNYDQYILVAYFEPKEFYVTILPDDGIEEPLSFKLTYSQSKFYTKEVDSKIGIYTTDDANREILLYQQSNKVGYNFVGFFVDSNNLVNVLNRMWDNDPLKNNLFLFTNNVIITCKYEKITYQIRFYDNRRHKYQPGAIGDRDLYIKELDGFYTVSYGDNFSLSNSVSYSGIEGYKVDGYYLSYNSDVTVSEEESLSNKITSFIRCEDFGDFKPSEAVAEAEGGKPIIRVYINLVPETYYLTLIEETYTTDADPSLPGNPKREFRSKTVEVKYGQKLTDVVVDTYRQDGEVKQVTLKDELPFKEGYDFDGWIISTDIDSSTEIPLYKESLIFGYNYDQDGNRLDRKLTYVDEYGIEKDYLYNYEYNMTLVAKYVGKKFTINYKYEVQNADKNSEKNIYTGGTLIGDIDIADIHDYDVSGKQIVPGISQDFDGTCRFGENVLSYTLLDKWMENYITVKNPDNTVCQNAVLQSWYYVRYQRNEQGDLVPLARAKVTPSMTFKSTEKVDLICVFTSPTSPVTFYDSLNNVNLSKPSSIHSSVPLKLKMTYEYKKDSFGRYTDEIGGYSYQLIELFSYVDVDGSVKYKETGDIRASFVIPAPDSSTAYTFDGMSFNITYGNTQSGAPNSITLAKTDVENTFEYIFQPEYQLVKQGYEYVKVIVNNYIINPGNVVFIPNYQARNNIKVEFYSSSDMTSVFSSQFIRAGGNYTIPTEAPKGEEGAVFLGWAKKGGDPKNLVTAGTFTADPLESSIVYYAVYDYLDIRITYRVGNEIILVQQLPDSVSTSSQLYSRNSITETTFVIGGYNFNGNTVARKDPVTGRITTNPLQIVYNHYKISKFKVVDEYGAAVYTKNAYISAGSVITLANLINKSAKNIYIEPYEDPNDPDDPGMEYVGHAVTYNINDVNYGPYVVDRNVPFSPLEILKENSILYQHGMRTIYNDTEGYLSYPYVLGGQKATLTFSNFEKKDIPSSVVIKGFFAYDKVEDGVLTFDDKNMINGFYPDSDEKKQIWQSVILPARYFTKVASNDGTYTISRFQIIEGIADAQMTDTGLGGDVDKDLPNIFTYTSVFGKNGKDIIRSVSFPTLDDATPCYSTLGSFAFADCSKLTTIVFSQNTAVINPFAFYNCTSLNAIECPKSLTTIQAGAFYNNINLRTVVFNSKLRTIGDAAFMLGKNINTTDLDESIYSDKLAILLFPLALTKIGKLAFANRSKLQSISWDEFDPVTKKFGNNCSIGDHSFAVAIDTEAYLRSKSVDELGMYIKKVSLTGNYTDNVIKDTADDTSDQDSVAVLNKAYSGEDRGHLLERDLSISFPIGLTEIGVGAFKYRKKITSLNFVDPISYLDKVTFSLKIRRNAFRVAENENLIYNAEEGKDYKYSITTANRELFASKRAYNISLSLPSNVTLIDDFAFAYRYFKNTVSFGNDLSLHSSAISELVIGDSAFMGYRKVFYTSAVEAERDAFKDFTLPLRVKSIGNYAFFNHPDLLGFKIKDYNSERNERISLETIGDYAFAKLEIVNTKISDFLNDNRNKNLLTDYTYHNVTNKENFIGTDDPYFLIQKDGAYAGKSYAKTGYYDSSSRTDTVVQLPKEITSIGEGAFLFNTALTQVIFDRSYLFESPSLSKIGSHAFEFCFNLKEITNDIFSPTKFDEVSYFELGDYAFRGCYSLNSNGSSNTLTLPSSLTYIPEGLFAECSSLKEIIMRHTNEFPIGDYAFYNCSSLQSFGNNNSTITSYCISVGVSSFEGCSSLTSLELDGDIMKRGKLTGSSFTEYASDKKPEREDLTSMMMPYQGAINPAYSSLGISSVANITYLKDDGLVLSQLRTLGFIDDADFFKNNEYLKDYYVDNEYLYTVNYTFREIINTRSFANCNSLELKFSSVLNSYALSAFAFADVKDMSLSGDTIADTFPFVFDGGGANPYRNTSFTKDGTPTDTQYFNYINNIGDTNSDGSWGIIGSCPFYQTGDDTTFKLNNNSTLYMRTQYVYPFGLSNVEISGQLHLNRVGNYEKYETIVKPIAEMFYKEQKDGNNFQNVLQRAVEKTSSPEIFSYFDVLYQVTPFQFGRSFINTTNLNPIYLDGAILNYGFANLHSKTGDLHIFSKSTGIDRGSSHSITVGTTYFGDIERSPYCINWSEFTNTNARGADNLKNHFLDHPYDITFEDGRASSNYYFALGVIGAINLTTTFSFIGQNDQRYVKVALNPYDCSLYSKGTSWPLSGYNFLPIFTVSPHNSKNTRHKYYVNKQISHVQSLAYNDARTVKIGTDQRVSTFISNRNERQNYVYYPKYLYSFSAYQIRTELQASHKYDAAASAIFFTLPPPFGAIPMTEFFKNNRPHQLIYDYGGTAYNSSPDRRDRYGEISADYKDYNIDLNVDEIFKVYREMYI